MQKLQALAVVIVLTFCNSTVCADTSISSIEINPLAFFVNLGNLSSTYWIGGINLQLDDPRTGLSIPFSYIDTQRSGSCCRTIETRVDLQLRRYSSARQSGYYIGGFVRAQNLFGSISADTDNSNIDYDERSQLRIGVGLTAGLRFNCGKLVKTWVWSLLLSTDSLYCTVGINIGKYAQDSLDFQRPGLGDADIHDNFSTDILDFELLNVGFRF